tara:strand:+ start:5573 stop:6814 length:1242 start_codon:yes stop_codon:yes gene_type:complete
MNILIYTHSWFPKIDGVTIRYKNIIDSLKDKHNIYLVTPDFNRIKNNKYPGIKVKLIDGMQLPKICRDDNPEVVVPNLKESYSIYNELADYCLENKIDIIHMTSPDLIINIFQLISINYNIPIISVYHTDVLEYLNVSKKNFFFKSIAWLTHLLNTYFLFDCLSTTSPLMAKKINDYKFYISNNPIWILPPSINTEIFKPSEKKYINRWKNNTTKLLYVGRITKEKSIDRILEIMDNNMSLVIIGYGGAINNLLDISKEKKLNVTFIDTIEQSELPYWYSSCDLFIMPSSTETLGFVTLEAMACGSVVLGYSAGGTLDIINNNKNGILFKSNDELKNYIDNFKNLNQDELSTNAIEYASTKSINKSSEKLLEKYIELINIKKENNNVYFINLFWKIVLNIIIIINQLIYNILV